MDYENEPPAMRSGLLLRGLAFLSAACGAAALSILAFSLSPLGISDFIQPADAQQKAPARTESRPVPEPAAPVPARIDRNSVLILIRSTLLALDQANKTGNYTVLRDLGAPGFQANSAARLAEIFAKQRNEGLDLSGVVVIDPQLTLLPQIEASGMLRMAGFFPSVPTQVNFELLFQPVSGRWRLFGISVDIGPSAPATPAHSPVDAGKSKTTDAPPGGPPPIPPRKPGTP